jgi:hypothetical protein
MANVGDVRVLGAGEPRTPSRMRLIADCSVARAHLMLQCAVTDAVIISRPLPIHRSIAGGSGPPLRTRRWLPHDRCRASGARR